ncbi:hypothetical protein ACIREO_07960 [Streptomyces sp. NPDC102441]|uniref:hypothetical protein n=1 Tax=Streptomyces sp. NPDC102441 TaxID=3366176 RepID=UPI003819689F
MVSRIHSHAYRRGPHGGLDALTDGGSSEAGAVYNRQVDELTAGGVVVGACVNAARADGSEAELLRRGFNLRVARDEFLRFTLEGATVITF